MKKERRKPKDIQVTTVSMTRALFDMMEEDRWAARMSRSAYIVEAINEYYEKRQAQRRDDAAKRD